MTHELPTTTSGDSDGACLLSGWRTTVSGQAKLSLSVIRSSRAPVLRMDYDFKSGTGFVVARRELQRRVPGDYAINWRMRSEGPINNLELKLIDRSGLNVWRYVFKDLRSSKRWKRCRIESRDIEFAWGPSTGAILAELGYLEFAIVATAGGDGKLWISDLSFEDCGPAERPRAHVSSGQTAPASEGDADALVWHPDNHELKPWIELDWVHERVIGGLVIEWLAAAPGGGFRVLAARRAGRKKVIYVAARAGGRVSNVYIPGTRARHIRLEVDSRSSGATIRVQSFEYSRSIEAFWYRVAAVQPRGWHPRWLHREQTEWTPSGTAEGTHSALLNTDGMLEVDVGTCSVEPMILDGGRLWTWADVGLQHELLDGWKPVPAVIWEAEDWCLRIEARASLRGRVTLRYRFENRGVAVKEPRLFIIVRPFQVTPPWQSFGSLGGVSRIQKLAAAAGAMQVDERIRVAPCSPWDAAGCMCFDDGFIADYLTQGSVPPFSSASDPRGFASGAIEFRLRVGPGESAERQVDIAACAESALAPAAFDWQAMIAVDRWTGSGWVKEAIAAGLTATAHILVTRSGAALQPGPRRYTRSWIRDGTMMSAALLRMGHCKEVRDFIRWYAPFQRSDGFVPCCVDAHGVDWLVEHDSHGQLLALIADHERFSGDGCFLGECWEFVERAVGCIESLAAADGLLPVSVSHEGYLAQPVHAYWDDFWAVRGVRDAVVLARGRGRHDLAVRWEALLHRLETSLYASIETTRAAGKLDFIPGSVEWADFDPTATANALYLLDVPAGLDRRAVERTFDKYLEDWRRKRSGAVAWANYTPYEIRIIGALVRLGRRADALELLRFFLRDRRPAAWNQWPEIAWQDRSAPAHVGDLPHTWIAAEYVLALRSLFAYERESDESLILAAGLADEWIAGEGVCVRKMPTFWGDLTYRLRRLDGRTVRFEIGGGIDGRLVLRPPLTAPLRSVSIDGRALTHFSADEVVISATPADVICVSG
ncbi:MAG: discoidin domain-containing protein [Steroidobacteraceae bacterium]